jgi:hypothetical protein
MQVQGRAGSVYVQGSDGDGHGGDDGGLVRRER